MIWDWARPFKSVCFVSYCLVSLITVACLEYKKWPFLIIVPATTIGNWVREFETWAPEISAVALGGTKMARELIRDREVMGNSESIGLKCQVVIASYEHTLTDGSFFKKREWEIMVCDEGHRLKNDDGKVFHAMNSIKANHRILLSGTPYLSFIYGLGCKTIFESCLIS
jgi:chromodomain-helicase-DNA-binding protein 4